MTVCMEWPQEGKEITRGDQGKGGEGCSEGFSLGGRTRSQQRGKQERMQENVIRKFQKAGWTGALFLYKLLHEGD